MGRPAPCRDERWPGGTNAGPGWLDSRPMSHPPYHWPARWQRWRRPAEAAFWVLVLGLQAGFASVVTWLDQGARLGRGWGWFAVLESTSVLAIGALVPAVAAFERRFPLGRQHLGRHLAWHLAATVPFCLLHVLLMVGLSQLAFGLAGEDYRVRNWAAAFGYEYLKDVRTYALILLAFWSYRLLLLRLQGEARLLDPPEPPAGAPPPAPAPAPARPERFLVRKLRKEFLVAASDIDWLQAQGNYVALRVQGHEYLLRSTLADFLAQLDPARFVRVHRSYAVNLDRVAEITPLEAGDARLKMRDGGEVPCSRRYREALGG